MSPPSCLTADAATVPSLSERHIFVEEVVSVALPVSGDLLVEDGEVELGQAARAPRLAQRRRVPAGQIARVGGPRRGQTGGRGGRRGWREAAHRLKQNLCSRIMKIVECQVGATR
jgi:hypothetical protein